MDSAVRYHINPDTGQPNKCLEGDTCAFGGPDFHDPDKHDAEVAWRARQLERGIIAYRDVLQAKEKEEEDPRWRSGRATPRASPRSSRVESFARSSPRTSGDTW